MNSLEYIKKYLIEELLTVFDKKVLNVQLTDSILLKNPVIFNLNKSMRVKNSLETHVKSYEEFKEYVVTIPEGTMFLEMISKMILNYDKDLSFFLENVFSRIDEYINSSERSMIESLDEPKDNRIRIDFGIISEKKLKEISSESRSIFMKYMEDKFIIDKFDQNMKDPNFEWLANKFMEVIRSMSAEMPQDRITISDYVGVNYYSHMDFSNQRFATEKTLLTGNSGSFNSYAAGIIGSIKTSKEMISILNKILSCICDFESLLAQENNISEHQISKEFKRAKMDKLELLINLNKFLISFVYVFLKKKFKSNIAFAEKKFGKYRVYFYDENLTDDERILIDKDDCSHACFNESPYKESLMRNYSSFSLESSDKDSFKNKIEPILCFFNSINFYSEKKNADKISEKYRNYLVKENITENDLSDLEFLDNIKDMKKEILSQLSKNKDTLAKENFWRNFLGFMDWGRWRSLSHSGMINKEKAEINFKRYEALFHDVFTNNSISYEKSEFGKDEDIYRSAYLIAKKILLNNDRGYLESGIEKADNHTLSENEDNKVILRTYVFSELFSSLNSEFVS